MMLILKITKDGKRLKVRMEEDSDIGSYAGSFCDEKGTFWLVDKVQCDVKLIFTSKFEPLPKDCVHRNLRTLDNFCLDCGKTVKEKK